MDKNFEIKDDILIKYTGSEKIVKIPENVTTIGLKCFYDNKNIEKVILPSNVKIINEKAFCECEKLKEINLENIEVIKEYAFENCKNLKNVNLESIVTLQSCVFAYSGLEEIIFPKTLKDSNYNNNNLITGCNMKQVVINCNISAISFLGAVKIDKLIINSDIDKLIAKNTQMSAFNLGNIIVKEIETNDPNYKIKDGMMYSADETKLVYCPTNINIETYTIPDSVKIIEHKCFQNNVNIKELFFGENVLEVGEHCFVDSNIKEIYLNKKLQEIKYGAFAFTKIKTIDLSKTDIKFLIVNDMQIFDDKELILPNEIEDIFYETNCANIKFKFCKKEEEISNNLKNTLNYLNIEYNYKKEQSLDKLIKSNKTFREANQIIKNYER